MASPRIAPSSNASAAESVSPAGTAMRSPLLISLVLFAGTLVLYLPSLNNGFVNYDDPAYVTSNARVLSGLSWANVRWAMTATTEASWHPLTWISHMVDVQFFNTNPRGHHLDNVMLHGLNVVLLFLLLRKATGFSGRSACVAALFAVHPLNVECVAWIAERKSLLSMLFLLLTFLAYDWYASKRRWDRYLLVVLLFALGLTAKPMIVTLPVLLLVWDYWPLKRTGSAAGSERQTVWPIVLEKIPLFALAATSSWITVFTQKRAGALGSTQLLPLIERLENAIYSYIAYIGKGIWPSRLAVFYPHPEGSLVLWKVILAGAMILIVTAVAWRYRKERPYLIAGWFWYLAAMLPMIGVIQVGRQAMADRYAYLPFVGLFVVAVWAVAESASRVKLSNVALGAIACAVVAGFGLVARIQTGYWEDSYRLFSHTVVVTNHNGLAEGNLGAALVERWRPDLAMPHLLRAVEYEPSLSTPHYNLGVLQQKQGNVESAKKEYELALKYSADPNEILQAHSNLGFLLMGLNELPSAEQQFSAALQLNPDKQNTLLGRGMVEYREGKLDAAVKDLSHAAEIAPMAIADFWLARALEAKGQTQAAVAAYQAALQLQPGMTEAQDRLKALGAGQ